MRDAASADITIGQTRWLKAEFDPDTQMLEAPGPAQFLLLAHNTGNIEDAYEAVITATTGPVTASLIGLDGQATQRIPLFRLPGRATGAILLQTDLADHGQGTVTVQVRSLTDGSIVGTATATVEADPIDCRDLHGDPATLGTGNVTARVRKGKLVIKGDTLANAITVEAERSGTAFVITGLDGTQVNGEVGPVRFDGVRKVATKLGKGNDYLLLGRIQDGQEGLPFTGKLKIKLGRGADELIFCDWASAGKVKAKTGADADAVEIEDAVFTQKVLLDTGAGADTVHIALGGGTEAALAEFRAGAKIRTRRDNDVVLIGSADQPGGAARFLARTKIDGGESVDTLDAGLEAEPNAHGNTFTDLRVQRFEQ